MTQCPNCHIVLPKRLVVRAGWKRIHCPSCSRLLRPILSRIWGVTFSLIIIFTILSVLSVNVYLDSGSILYLILMILFILTPSAIILLIKPYFVNFIVDENDALKAKKKADSFPKEFTYFCPRCLFQTNDMKKKCPKCASGILERCR